MNANPIRPGYHWSQLFDVRGMAPGETLASASIAATLNRSCGGDLLTGPVGQVDGSGGASYASNRVLVEFPSANTGAAAVIGEAGRVVNVLVFVTLSGKTFVYDAGEFPVVLTP
jgi:hypothetical protein